MKAVIAIASLAAVLAVAACSTDKQPPMIIGAYVDAEGPHVQTHTDGTASVGLVGAQAGALVDRVLKNDGTALLVADRCGNQTAIAVHGLGSGSANAGAGAVNNLPGVGADHSIGFDVGPAAENETFGDMLAKAGNNQQAAVTAFATCPQKTTP